MPKSTQAQSVSAASRLAADLEKPMGKPKHTPKEWLVIPPDAYNPSRAMVCANGTTIYDAPLTNETKANAYLIAASIELREACEKALADITDVLERQNGMDPSLNIFASMETRAALRAAIAKAEVHQ